MPRVIIKNWQYQGEIIQLEIDILGCLNINRFEAVFIPS